MADGIKACPFCGADDAHVIGITATGESSVICYTCGGETAHKASAAEAIAAWNRRPAADAFHEAPAECDTCGGLVACPRCDAEPADAGRDAAFERAMKSSWAMVIARDTSAPGSYHRGHNNGVIAALQTVRENYERECKAALASQQAVKP